MIKRNLYNIILILLLGVFLLGGCSQQNQTRVKGIKEKGMVEPTIEVELADGKIKKIGIEEYVAGVVAGEMQRDWPVNAYAAQAIKARTFTMKRLEENGNNRISSQHEEAQAYKPENINDEIKEAVKMTRGEVVTYQGEYIKAWFHSSAGGETTTAKVGLAYKEDEPPYIKSVESPDEEAPADIKSWQVKLTGNDMLQVLQKAGERAGVIKDVKILKKDKTGRIVDIKIVHNQGSKQMKGAEFRTAVGPDKLKSTKVESISKEGNMFIFTGSGYGHGVGMSQWGAYKLAKDGKKPEEIINYYFKGIEIVKKWQ